MWNLCTISGPHYPGYQRFYSRAAGIFGVGLRLVCYTAVFSVVTQRSSPLVGRSVTWRHLKQLCSRLPEGRHIFGRRPKPRAAKRVTIKTWQKPETALEKSLPPRVGLHRYDPRFIYLFILFPSFFEPILDPRFSITDLRFSILDPDFPVNFEVSLIKIILCFFDRWSNRLFRSNQRF